MKHKIVPLSDKIKSIILGSLLGDGSLKIHKGYKNARFSFRHSVKQKDYFFWKVKLLKEISSMQSVFKQEADGYSKNKKLRYQSRALEALTEIYLLTHKKNKLVIRRKWLNLLTPLSLAVWWFDDGSLIANTRKGVFCTEGFSKESIQIIVRYLKKVWGINTHIGSIRKSQDSTQDEYWRIWIRSTEELKNFLRIIIPYTPKPMLKKVLLLYKDTKLQQRWISEVSKLSGISYREIYKAVTERKKELRNFRE